jgi:hypothetical protein
MIDVIFEKGEEGGDPYSPPNDSFVLEEMEPFRNPESLPDSSP